MSVCQSCPASASPIGLPFSTMLERIITSGIPGSWKGLAALASSLPKRALKSASSRPVSFWRGKRTTPRSPRARSTASKSPSDSGCARSSPSIVAPRISPLVVTFIGALQCVGFYAASGSGPGPPVKAHRDVLEIRAGRGVAPHDKRVVARHDELGRIRQLAQSPVALHHGSGVEDDGERPRLVHVGVEVRRVRGEHDPADPGVHAHGLQSPGVPADPVQREAGRELGVAVVKAHPPLVHLAHHRGHLVRLVGVVEEALSHVAAGRVGHLLVLQMEGRGGKKAEVADVVVVQVRDDHVLHLFRLDAEEREAALGRMDHPAAAAGADPGVEAGVDDESAGRRAGEPDEIIEIARALVRVAADEVLARLAVREACVPDREDFVDVGNASPLFPILSVGHYNTPDPQGPRGSEEREEQHGDPPMNQLRAGFAVSGALLLGVLFGPLSAPPVHAQDAQRATPPSGKALLFIFRSDREPRGAQVPIAVNAVHVGDLEDGTFLSVSVDPGRTFLRSGDRVLAMLGFQTAPDQTYFVWVEAVHGLTVVQTEMRLVSEDEGRRALAQRRAVTPAEGRVIPLAPPGAEDRIIPLAPPGAEAPPQAPPLTLAAEPAAADAAEPADATRGLYFRFDIGGSQSTAAGIND